ncbi:MULTISPECIES: hypothetical protein [unclassified Streptomyces]|uniref:hypothetical protein n=1 Tax=Streptomyces sp. NBC_00723 TaxID=2903673 RepID=UPI003870208A
MQHRKLGFTVVGVLAAGLCAVLATTALASADTDKPQDVKHSQSPASGSKSPSGEGSKAPEGKGSEGAESGYKSPSGEGSKTPEGKGSEGPESGYKPVTR